PRYGRESNIRAIPCIDGHYIERQVGQLFFTQLSPHSFVDLIRYTVFRQFRQHFGPGECCAFAWCNECGFAPCRPMVNTQFPLAVNACFLYMHVEAESAAVELRGSD